MILTVTPNPAIDRVLLVRDLCLGGVVRAEREAVSPCGKGVIASMVIHELGGRTVALGLKAGTTGNFHSELLGELGVPHDFIPAQGETRTLVVLVDLAAGKQSSISAPTLKATSEHLGQLIDLIDEYADQAWGVIFGGSLPPGFPVDAYAHLLRFARGRGLVTLLDTSGDALVQGVSGLPHILKINEDELSVLAPNALGIGGQGALVPYAGGKGPKPDYHRLRDAGDDIVELAETLKARLNQWASDALIITLGKRGTLLVTDAGSFYAVAPTVPVVNTAGAGDAVSGVVMLARREGADWPKALVRATAAAAAVVMTDGSGICQRSQVEKLQLELRSCRVDNE